MLWVGHALRRVVAEVLNCGEAGLPYLEFLSGSNGASIKNINLEKRRCYDGARNNR